MTFGNNNSTIRYRQSTKKGEQQIKLVSGGYPEKTLHSGSLTDFERSVGVRFYSDDRRGVMRLTERQAQRLNTFLKNI